MKHFSAPRANAPFAAPFAAPLTAALTAMLTLGGCGFHRADSAPPSAAAAMPCPHIAVLEEASSLTEFLPNRGDVASEVTTAHITGIAGACSYNKSLDTITVKFRAGFTAANGPANGGKPLVLPYFVSVSHGMHIIVKANYSIPLKFEGNASIATATSKELKVELPDDPATADYDVLIGFQMTPDQLAYAAAHPGG